MIHITRNKGQQLPLSTNTHFSVNAVSSEAPFSKGLLEVASSWLDKIIPDIIDTSLLIIIVITLLATRRIYDV